MGAFLSSDLVTLIKTAGYLGLFGIVFAESGLFVGFFLPGDSLLFTAGLLASQNFLNIWILLPLVFAAAVVGDNFGYAFGKKIGPALFTKDKGIFFRKEHLERARVFYERHGGRTIILARFLPVIRTFVPIVAGAGRMRYSTFLFYNMAGGALWSCGLLLSGYYLSAAFPGADHYLVPIVLGIIIVSALPSLAQFIKHRRFF